MQIRRISSSFKSQILPKNKTFTPPKFCTFFVLLDGWWRAGHLHGQAVGSAEGMAVPNDERPGLPVLQQTDGWKKESGHKVNKEKKERKEEGEEIRKDETEREMTRGKQDEGRGSRWLNKIHEDKKG